MLSQLGRRHLLLSSIATPLSISHWLFHGLCLKSSVRRPALLPIPAFLGARGWRAPCSVWREVWLNQSDIDCCYEACRCVGVGNRLVPRRATCGIHIAASSWALRFVPVEDSSDNQHQASEGQNELNHSPLIHEGFKRNTT